jgi:hypothetical protein
MACEDGTMANKKINIPIIHDDNQARLFIDKTSDGILFFVPLVT